MTRVDVVIIEDRQEIAVRLTKALAVTPGLELVGLAATLDHGLQLLYDLRPRVVLVDLGLPDGSGIDVVRAAADADWTIDALVVSIFGDEGRVIEALQAGARGYILKGGDLSAVGQDVLSMLDGGSPISPAIARHVLNLLKTVPDSRPASEETSLTNREVEILRAVARGYKRREIGENFGISAGTVGNHITNIYRKLKVSSNIEAVAQAARIGVL